MFSAHQIAFMHETALNIYVENLERVKRFPQKHTCFNTDIIDLLWKEMVCSWSIQYACNVGTAVSSRWANVLFDVSCTFSRKQEIESFVGLRGSLDLFFFSHGYAATMVFWWFIETISWLGCTLCQRRIIGPATLHPDYGCNVWVGNFPLGNIGRQFPGLPEFSHG